MTRGVRLYLVGSIVLVSLAGCGRGFFQEREPWRAEAEIACLKSGAVKEGADIVRIDPISGPGMCGADYPLKVAALGEASASYGFADESLRPPAAIGGQPRWPVNQQPPGYPPPATYQPQAAPQPAYPAATSQPPAYGAPPGAPLQLEPPIAEDDANLPPDASYPAAPYRAPRTAYPSQQPDASPRLGPSRGDVVGAVGPVAVKPTATLACPIVSALDRWIAESVQPAAQRWFGTKVVEIKQISAYSCRGMNGNPSAHISEHAFGNALDIAAFTLADGRRISVKDGWIGLPEEQGFLRDVQGGACQQFTTVLAPGSNVYHYDHIHVDLMRRASRRLICQPAAQSGEAVAARAQQRRYGYGQREPDVTSSIQSRKQAKSIGQLINEEDEFRDY
ncbi:extensin-like domain-containing protein [Bradyrhizobium oligotrophicum]|uniref:extensin-like domain-containing protein n=1 Tax=Bradyrhizobium oligotrophicum TaxID=44255 RepID=UPI0005A97DE3|nr:extensin family protein [Bradyrhizobium oligotrophicum]